MDPHSLFFIIYFPSAIWKSTMGVDQHFYVKINWNFDPVSMKFKNPWGHVHTHTHIDVLLAHIYKYWKIRICTPTLLLLISHCKLRFSLYFHNFLIGRNRSQYPWSNDSCDRCPIWCLLLYHLNALACSPWAGCHALQGHQLAFPPIPFPKQKAATYPFWKKRPFVMP